MFGSTVIDVALGLVMLFIVFGVASSAVTEQISQFLSLRSQNLWESVCALLDDHKGSGIAAQVFNHQLIKGLSVARTANPQQPAPPANLAPVGAPQPADEAVDLLPHPADDAMPTYIPSEVFAKAFLDVLIQNSELEQGEVTITQLATATFGEEVGADLNSAVKTLIHDANGDADVLKQKIADWFDAAMARASGWYQHKVQLILFGVSLALVVAANADCFMIINELWTNTSVRAAVASQADTTGKAAASPTAIALADQDELLGWATCSDAEPATKAESPGATPAKSACTPTQRAHTMPAASKDFGAFVLKIFGLLGTAYAATLGAPFWFKALQQVLSLRNAITGKENSK